MKIKFVKIHGRYAYYEGDIAELPNEDAKELLKSGHAIEAENEQEDKTKDSEETTGDEAPSRGRNRGK